MAMDGSQPLEFLLSLLDQIAKEDPSNVFEYPVDGSVVKGYYDKIKHPMCFYVMREKLRKQEYRTWRNFTRDFELICENAKLFNPPQNRVHKLAINLQRAGRKVLQGNELPGRRCLSVLHPDGPKQAADEEAAEILVTKNEPQYSSQLLLTAETDEQQIAAGDDRQDQQQGHPIADHKPVQPVLEDLAAAHQLWDATSEQLTTADWGLLFRELPDPQLDNVTQQLKQPVVYQPYCSLEPQQQQQPAAQQHQKDANEASPAKSQLLKVTADWLLARQPVTWRCQWLYTRIQELTSVIAALQSQGSTVPISFPAAPGTAAATTPKAAGAAAGGAEGLVSSNSAAEAMEGLSLLQVQQGGMLLQQHVAAIQKQGPILQSPFFAAHLAGTHSDPLPPVANRQAAQQHEQQQHVQQQQDQQQTEGQGESSKQPAEDQQQQQQQDSAADMDVDQPSGGATATAKVPEAAAAAPEGSGEVKEQQQQEQQQQEATNSGTAEQDGAAAAAVAASEVISKAATGPADPAAAAAAHPAAGAAAVGPPDTQECDAALIFSSLELVEHQLVAARLMIARAFGIEVTLAPTGVRLGQYTAARVWGDSNTGLNPAAAAHGPGGQKRSAAAAGLGLARGFSGALDRGPGQGRGLQREGSLAGSMKKRRVERSGAAGVAGSVDADDGVLSPSSSLPARLLDRVVTSIHIPSVREIPKEEQEALSAAATTWRAAVKAHGQRAGLAKPPVEVRRVLEAAAADEGSSSEDTSDEAYAIMHKPLEEDEHIRLCGPTGGGRKRNKNKTKQSGSKQQQQGKSEQQQQLSKQQQQQQQQQQAAQDQPGSPRPARGKGNAANGASAAAAPPTSVATVPVVSQAAPAAAAAAAVPPLKASIDSSKLPPAITIPNSLPTSPHKFSRTPAASPVVAAAAAALAAAAAGTATPAAAAGLQSASPAAATAAGGVLQLSQQQVLWLQQHAGQPVMVLTPSVTSPSAAAAVAAAAEKQQPPSAGNKQAAGAAAAAGARSGGAAAGNAAAASSGGAGGSGLHSTRSRELPARLTSTQLASTRANGAVAGSGGSSRGVATRTSSGGIRDKDVDKAAAAAADKPERSKEANAGSGRGSGSGKDKDVAASSGKQQSERSGSVRKTVSPAAAAAPAAVAKDVKEPSKSPAVVSRSPSAAVAGTVAAGTRRASAAAAAAASAAKRRSSNRVKAQEASGKVKARTGK